MGIDGISGGKPPLGGIGSAPSTSSPGSAKETFGVEGSSVSAPAQASDADRLQSGELGLDEYLEARVDQAVSHLAGVLSPQQLDGIKAQLREQLEGADPVLRQLVQRASGAVLSEGDV
jgi:hypothetical protein